MSIAKNPSPSQSSQIIKFEPTFIDDSEDDFNPNSGWLLLLYGASGVGKTWFAGTAQDCLYLNTGQGTDTLNSPLFKLKHPNIRRKRVNIYETFDQGTIKKATAFDKVTDTLDYFLDNKELREIIRTIVIDDATFLRAFAKLRGVEIVDEMAGRRGDDKRKLNRFIPQQPDDVFREMAMIEWFCMQYLPIFKNEGINFLLLAHERQIYGKAAKMMDERPLKAIKPGFSGQTFPDEVPKHFDEVWFMVKKSDREGEHSQIKTGGSGIEAIKTRRAGVFKKYEENVTYEYLLEKRRLNKLDPSYIKETGK